MSQGDVSRGIRDPEQLCRYDHNTIERLQAEVAQVKDTVTRLDQKMTDLMREHEEVMRRLKVLDEWHSQVVGQQRVTTAWIMVLVTLATALGGALIAHVIDKWK